MIISHLLSGTAATHRNLASMVEEGTFRRDLYYRINVIRLEMPPLRERIGDVPPLAEAFLRRLSATRGKVVDSISREAFRRLAIDLPPADGRTAKRTASSG